MANSHVIQLPSKKDGFDPAEFRATIKTVDAKQPDPAAVEKLKQFIVDFPHLTDLVDLYAMTLERIATRLGGGQSTNIMLQATFEKLKREYGEAATPLERVLVDHINMCGARLADVEWRYESNATSGKLTLAQADFWERQLNHAQHRYLKAVETLARVRKLNINIQVNIGDKQVITG